MTTAELIATACAVLALPTWKYIVRPLRSLSRFVEDWNGEAQRPGVPERLGVMARLAVVEENVSVIRHEVTPNSSSSMKDAVVRIESKLDGHLEQAASDRAELIRRGVLKQ